MATDYLTMTPTERREAFNDACVGFGFELIEQNVDGVYCTGCNAVHKRPTKMYANGPVHYDGRPKERATEVLCKYQVIRLYNPAD